MHFPSETLREEGLLENTTLHKAKWKAGTDRQHPSPWQENVQVTAGASSYHVSHLPTPRNSRKQKAKKPRQKGWEPQPLGRPRTCLHCAIYQETV